MKNTVLLIFFLVAANARAGFLPEGAFSKDARGVTGASFLKDLSSPRFYAMGQSGSSIFSPESVFYNPAGIYVDSAHSFYAAYQSLLEGSSREQISYSAASGAGRWAFSWLRSSYGSFDRLNARAENTGSFSPSDNAFLLSISRADTRIFWGASVKFAQTDLVYEKGWAAALDIGLISRSVSDRGSEYSLYLRNLGTPMKINGKEDPLPFEFGAGLKSRWKAADLYFEGKFPSYDSPYLTAGAELPLQVSQNYGFALRAGLNPRNKSRLGWAAAVSAGFGFYSPSLRMDYAYVPYGDLGDTHRFSFSWLFGKLKRERRYADIEAELERRIFMKNKKFALAPLYNKADSKYPNLGYIFASELAGNIKEGGYGVAEAGSEIYSRAEKKLEEGSPLDFCRTLSADYCVYGEIRRRAKTMFYEIHIYDMDKEREAKSFVLESPDSYDFKKAAYRAFSYMVKD